MKITLGHLGATLGSLGRISLAMLTLTLTLTLTLVVARGAQAEPLSVWSAGATQAPMVELVQRYQSQSGNTVKIEFAPVGALLKKLAEGGRPDVLLLSQDVARDVDQMGLTAAGSAQPVASVGVGVAVRAGAALPDISTVDALRTALLNAKSITYINPSKGTSGKHFARVLEQLGIAAQVQSKTLLGEAGFVVEPVARGEVEMGIQQITEILPVPGVTLVGPLPDAVQKITTYTIAKTRFARDPALADAFVQYILDGDSWNVFKRKGFSAPP